MCCCPLYFTLCVPLTVQAAIECRAGLYSITLSPNCLYAVIDLDSESLVAASTDDSHEVYWIPVDHPYHWQWSQFTSEGDPLP